MSAGIRRHRLTSRDWAVKALLDEFAAACAQVGRAVHAVHAACAVGRAAAGTAGTVALGAGGCEASRGE